MTSSHDAVLRQRLLSPQTQLDARDRIPNQLIALQFFLGVPGWGWGANVPSYSPNLAHCAVQTTVAACNIVALRHDEVKRGGLPRAATSLPSSTRSEGAEWIRTFRSFNGETYTDEFHVIYCRE